MSSTEPANTFPDPAQPAPAPTQEIAQPSMRDVPLGTLIFRAGLLGEEQLEDALQEGMRTGKRLGEVLLERGWLNERDLGRMLAGQKGLPFVDVNVSDVESDALEELDEEDARRQVALPLFYQDGKLVIAVGDPSNELVLESLRRELETEFQLVVAPHGQLRQVIDEAYARPAPAPDPAPQVDGVLFPELLPQAQAESHDATQPEPETVLEFTPAVEPEPEPEPQAEAASEIDPEPESEDTTQPFSGSTPTLLSRMLFPSVRHASQEVETAAAEDHESEAQFAEEPEAQSVEEPEAQSAEEPEAEASEPAEEDFAELEVPAVPEMPLPSFEQPAPESQGAEVGPPSEPAPEPEPESVPEPQAEAEPEPEAEAEPEPEAEAAETPKYSVLVRLRDGETLRIGEPSTADEASALAQDAVGQISSAAGNGTWPLFAGRYLSPDTIVSVDLNEESPDT
jgi:MshEN domain